MNKRDFIAAACATVAAGVSRAATETAGPLGATLGAVAARPPELDASAGCAAWSRYAGERFAPAAGTAAPALVLRSVTQHAGHDGGEQFTLLFNAEGELPDATTLSLRHAASGQQLAVFVQPAGRDAGGRPLVRAEYARLA